MKLNEFAANKQAILNLAIDMLKDYMMKLDLLYNDNKLKCSFEEHLDYLSEIMDCIKFLQQMKDMVI